MKKLSFGLIGCGRISKNHFEALAHFDEAEFVTCCDIIQERAEQAAKQYNLKSYYTNYIEMLEKEDLDAVSICTPSGLHAEMGIEVSKRHINVITEKPMALNIETSDLLIQACETNKVKLFVVKQNRLNPTMQLLKKAIEKKRFGKIYLAQSNVFWQRPQSYYDQAPWRGTWKYDGGAFLNQASHYIDALYWLLGDVDSVRAETATMARNIEAEDTGVAILRFKNGALATINVTMLTFPKNFEGSVTILGEKGTVKVGGIAINRIEKWEFEDYDDDDRIVEESNYQPPSIYGFGHIPYYANVIDTLLGRATPYTDGKDGRKSVEIIQALYKSARLGKKIHLPLTYESSSG